MEKLIINRLQELARKEGKLNKRRKEPITIKLDGDMWCAHRDSFENIQESHCTFGETEQQAFNKLINEEMGAYITISQEQMNLEVPSEFTHIYHKELQENGYVGEQTTIV